MGYADLGTGELMQSYHISYAEQFRYIGTGKRMLNYALVSPPICPFFHNVYYIWGFGVYLDNTYILNGLHYLADCAPVQKCIVIIGKYLE